MANLKQYKEGDISIDELKEFTGQLLRAKHDNNRKDRWQNMLDEQYNINRKTPTIQTKTTNKRIYMWMAAAAAILLLFVSQPLIQNFTSPSYGQLADAFIADDFYENLEISRNDQDITQLKINAITAYNQKDFPTAITYFESIVAQGVATDEQYFFLGLSYLYNQQYDNTITNLLKVQSRNNQSKFKQETQWFLALAYIQIEDIDNAKTLLSHIKQGMWNYDKAQQLLDAMK